MNTTNILQYLSNFIQGRGGGAIIQKITMLTGSTHKVGEIHGSKRDPEKLPPLRKSLKKSLNLLSRQYLSTISLVFFSNKTLKLEFLLPRCCTELLYLVSNSYTSQIKHL